MQVEIRDENGMRRDVFLPRRLGAMSSCKQLYKEDEGEHFLYKLGDMKFADFESPMLQIGTRASITQLIEKAQRLPPARPNNPNEAIQYDRLAPMINFRYAAEELPNQNDANDDDIIKRALEMADIQSLDQDNDGREQENVTRKVGRGVIYIDDDDDDDGDYERVISALTAAGVSSENKVTILSNQLLSEPSTSSALLPPSTPRKRKPERVEKGAAKKHASGSIK